QTALQRQMLLAPRQFRPPPPASQMARRKPPPSRLPRPSPAPRQPVVRQSLLPDRPLRWLSPSPPPPSLPAPPALPAFLTPRLRGLGPPLHAVAQRAQDRGKILPRSPGQRRHGVDDHEPAAGDRARRLRA